MVPPRTIRRFAWRPMWIHQEYPPWGLGRLRWLRWIEMPEEDLQTRIDRAYRSTVISAAVAVAAVIVLLVLMLSGARASEPTCPPKRYFCWEVRAAVAAIGVQEARERARKCGWSAARIAEAEKCLR